MLPLLVKFLFTSGKLSVQVHPDDAYAAEHHHSRGKTEMWHVLAAEPGAQHRRRIPRAHFGRASARGGASGEIEELLAWHEARPGDTFFIPAGTVHAIGAGLTLCEIQQLSDITYRLYDYGRPRELHIEEALAVGVREPHRARMQSRQAALVVCDYFTVTRHECFGTLEVSHPPDLLVVIDGAGNFGPERVHAGEVFYAPPGTNPFEATGRLTFLGASTVGDFPKSI